MKTLKAHIYKATPQCKAQKNYAKPVTGWILTIDGNLVGIYATEYEALERVEERVEQRQDTINKWGLSGEAKADITIDASTVTDKSPRLTDMYFEVAAREPEIYDYFENDNSTTKKEGK
mgnify:CR=1 FL=1|tara:strand:- start:1704 stop:2060 length:357 start_codon:yes stop_codon:yes gene_type:complete